MCDMHFKIISKNYVIVQPCTTSRAVNTSHYPIQHIRTTSSLIKYAEDSSDDEQFNSGKRRHPRDQIDFDDASDYDVVDDNTESDGDDDDDDDDDDSDRSIHDDTTESVDGRGASNDMKNDVHTAIPSCRKVANMEQHKRSTRCNTEASQAVDLNPGKLSRSVKIGCKDGETLFNYHFRCLFAYKEIYGNLLVKQKYVVPWSIDWPEDMWGLKLGNLVSKIRGNSQYKNHTEELTALGFVFSP